MKRMMAMVVHIFTANLVPSRLNGCTRDHGKEQYSFANWKTDNQLNTGHIILTDFMFTTAFSDMNSLHTFPIEMSCLMPIPIFNERLVFRQKEDNVKNTRFLLGVKRVSLFCLKNS